MTNPLAIKNEPVPLLNAKLVNRASHQPLYEGAGFAKREDRSFSIHCACPTMHGDPLSWINNAPPAGTLLDDKDLYDFVANIPNGDLLVAERVHPNTTYNSSGIYEVCTKSRNVWISDVYPVPEHTRSMTVHFDLVNTNYYQHPIPPTDRMNCQIYEFTHQRIRHENILYVPSFFKDKTSIRVDSRNPFNIYEMIQVLQSILSFAFFTPVYFSTAHIASDNKICTYYSAGSKRTNAHPICGSPSQPGYSNRTIYKFIAAALNSLSQQPNDFGDLLIHANLIASHRRSHIEELAFTSCKALEYTIHRDHYRSPSTSNDEINQECESIKKFLSNNTHPLMQDRIIGLLNSATLEGTNARIRRLENESIVPSGTTLAFKNVRHKVAHGHLLKQDEIDQAFWNTHKVIDAFNQLLLHECGYKGPISVFSEPGWPITQL